MKKIMYMFVAQEQFSLKLAVASDKLQEIAQTFVPTYPPLHLDRETFKSFHTMDDQRPLDTLFELKIVDDLAYMRVYCHSLAVLACWLGKQTDTIGIYRGTFEPIFV